MQTATITASAASLPQIEPRVGYCGGAGMPMAHARWIRTNAIIRVEPGPDSDAGFPQIRLFSAGGHLDVHGGSLQIGMSKTFHGEATCVSLAAYVERDIDNLLNWERRNPRERRYDEPRYAVSALKEEVAHQILMGPEGRALIVELDRALAYGPQTSDIVSLRRDLRRDEDDLAGTSGRILSKVLALA